MQQGYGIQEPEEIVEFLKENGIEYYLRVPNEDKHTINQRLGMKKLRDGDYLELIYRSPSESSEQFNELYRIK